MKISASLYSAKNNLPMASIIDNLDRCHIDYFHIDCNDDPKVFEDIRKIRKVSDTPIDLHIISKKPEKYIDLLHKIPVERVSFQYENLTHFFEIPEIKNTSFGLAITTDTDVKVFEEYKDFCEFVLIMTTTPGQSGGQFDKENFQRIRTFRNQFPGKEIEVDGGVNDEIGFILRILGVQTVVSGSYLVNHESMAEALLHLRSSVVHSDFRIRDFMISRKDAPIVTEDSSIHRIIQTIDNHKLGFAMIENDDRKLVGLCSNADLRKGILKKFDELNDLNLEDIINRNPVTIEETKTISEMLHFIQSKKNLISFLPVVNDKKQLTGTISFIHSIRSES